ncbi:glycosyltransferase family 4 protein [Novipirellula rosea]|uniref:Glycosyltransferase family 4 protein n=1 Tax=Novipirellula rosea TaxID=1031540 RepID=A0ABP8N1X7_9BACT
MLQNQTELASIPVQVPVVLPNKPAASPPCSIEASVLHVINGEYFSGAERVQSHLGRCLPNFGIAADFVCVKPGKFPQVMAEQDRQWGRCHLAPMKSRFDLRAVFRIRDLVRAYGYELLHAHTPRTAMVASAASRLTGVPWVYHVHSPAARDSVNRWSNRINSLMERASLSGCSHLITVSESLRLDCIAKGASEDKVTVVHNGVPSIRPERIHHPVVGGRWVLGMVALMRPRKGLEVVLDALKILRGEGLDVVLRCIGPFETAEYETEINDQIDRLNLRRYVERVGFTDDVPRELAKVDALVLPSLFGEGLPMVVLEAMAAAVPVIATRVEGTPEAVTDGVEGLLAEPRDAVSLANKIRSLVMGEYDWTTMAEAAHQRQTQSFSDLSMAWGTAEVYRKLIDSPRELLGRNKLDEGRQSHVSQRDNFVAAGHRD